LRRTFQAAPSRSPLNGLSRERYDSRWAGAKHEVTLSQYEKQPF
jgi:hypothetical protein